MPKLKTDLLREGMIVGADVKNIDSMLLIPSGASLTERQINILRAWGVEEVDVKASGDFTDAGDFLLQLPAEEAARLTSETKGLFWRLDGSNAVQMEIFKHILERKVQAGLNR
ncbi:MAG: hypothetical protein HZA90_02275 [Verrucomicrobia bacterium]|nr:hypothetical protein [Verrucomicrobiota bacterium]